MTWGMVDDGHYDHPKVLAIPKAIRNACDGLYWRAISRCNRTLSDGYITQGDLDLVDGEPKHVEALLEVGLFDRDRRGRLRVHNFLTFNKSKAEVLAGRQKKADAGRAGGLASGRARAKHAAEHKRATGEAGASNGVANELATKRTPVPNPNPSHNSIGRTSSTSLGDARARHVADGAQED